MLFKISCQHFLLISESDPKSDEEIGPKLEEKSEGTTDDLADTKATETEKKPSTKIREWDIGKESK